MLPCKITDQSQAIVVIYGIEGLVGDLSRRSVFALTSFRVCCQAFFCHI